MSSLLKQSLQDAPILSKNGYPYIIHPLCDGFPEVSPILLQEVVCNLKKMIKPYLPFDKIITVEAMGIPLATLLSKELNIPFTIIRKRSYKFEDEISIQQETGYSKNTLFINGLKQHESAIIVDDILSTGGTIQAILIALQNIPVRIKSCFVVIDKGKKAEEITKKTNIPIHTLIKILIQQKKIVFL